jgi:cellulose synthase/poly-beta-1,6-N-acetylglucosamine synthase-like glycosyltransferase
MTDRVSIIMPVYNAADFVGDAAQSVGQQTYADWELLVIDDCSSDGTVTIIESLARSDPRIRLVRLERNGGACAQPWIRGIQRTVPGLSRQRRSLAARKISETDRVHETQWCSVHRNILTAEAANMRSS